MGVTVRQRQPGKGKPWWVFICYQGERKAKKVGDRKAAEAVAAKIREKIKLGELKIEKEITSNCLMRLIPHLYCRSTAKHYNCIGISCRARLDLL